MMELDPSEINKPSITEKMAIEMASRIYGLKVLTINEMVSYDDKNFHIKVEKNHQNPHIQKISEDGYTLKITNTLKSALPGHFDSLHKAMRYLNNKDLRLPQPVPNMEGKSWVLENCPVYIKGESCNVGTGPCGIHLLTYLPGVTVRSLNYTENLLKQWGSLLAKFHNALLGFSDDNLHGKNLFWDYSHIPELVNFADGLDQNKVDLVLGVLKAYTDSPEKQSESVRMGYIHGDFNENNVLVRERNGNYSVDGILDLDDMHYSSYIWDIGVMLAYVSLECKNIDPLDGMCYALRGYLLHNTLTDFELSLLKVCITCRLCQSLVMGAHGGKRDPNNTYLLQSQKHGWNRLQQIWETPDEVILEAWKKCRKIVE